MINSKNSKWLRGIHRVTSFDAATEITHHITQNPAMTGKRDRFVYQCKNGSGKLLADRKIDAETALVLIDSWNWKVDVVDLVSVGR